MNFDKAAISTKVMELLEINLNQEEDKKTFARLLKGNKLNYNEANAFIETILRALFSPTKLIKTIYTINIGLQINFE